MRGRQKRHELVLKVVELEAVRESERKDVEREMETRESPRRERDLLEEDVVQLEATLQGKKI